MNIFKSDSGNKNSVRIFLRNTPSPGEKSETNSHQNKQSSQEKSIIHKKNIFLSIDIFFFFKIFKVSYTYSHDSENRFILVQGPSLRIRKALLGNTHNLRKMRVSDEILFSSREKYFPNLRSDSV